MSTCYFVEKCRHYNEQRSSRKTGLKQKRERDDMISYLNESEREGEEEGQSEKEKKKPLRF